MESNKEISSDSGFPVTLFGFYRAPFKVQVSSQMSVKGL